MKAVSKTWFVIINPTSGNGSAKKKWPKIKRLLDGSEFVYEFAFTKYSKHETALVQNALSRNIKNILSIGGDGTLHHIVNGIFSQKEIPSSQVHVGVIPIGTGNDWVKTHHIPKHLETAINIIKSGNIALQDIGKIEFLNTAIPPVYFNNTAGIGFDGYVVSKVEKYKQLGALAYLYGALASALSFENFSSTIGIYSEELFETTFMISVGICQFSGGGMQLTNKPNPFDGYFDISIAKNVTLWDILKNILNLFNGKISSIKKIKQFKNKELTVKIQQNDLPLIQADGELIGSGSVRITMLPKAFSFFTLKK